MDAMYAAETICPACGQRLGLRDEVYAYAATGELAGCSDCIERCDAGEWEP